MWIQITEEDIAGSSYNSVTRQCPTARALNRVFERKDAEVGLMLASIGGQSFFLERSHSDWIFRWTLRQKVDPTIFKIDDDVVNELLGGNKETIYEPEYGAEYET